jgi:elongator complex protein 3
MPGLPGSNARKDLRLFKKLFKNQDFKPDQLKLYPCQVMPCSELEEMYWKKKYEPYSKQKIKGLLIAMLKIVPRYCRVMRVMREIPPEYIVAGTKRIDLRAEIERELRQKRARLKEIRYREVGFVKKDLNLNLRLRITKYKASKGKEYFLEIVNKQDILFGLLRLRLYDKSAIIRELHVYGKALKLGEKNKIAIQHQGIGKWLITEAERIVKREASKSTWSSARKKKINKLSIISGVGVRDYYKKLGYKLENTYMVKKIK